MKYKIYVLMAVIILIGASVYFFNLEAFLTGRQAELLSGSYEVYDSEKYGFSLQYPKEMTVAEFKEGEYGTIILLQNDTIPYISDKSGAGKQFSFQIFVNPFDEEEAITPERILQDLPGMMIEKPQEVVITKNKINGLIFLSDGNREVWFVNGGYLFQVTTLMEFDRMIGEVIDSFQF